MSYNKAALDSRAQLQSLSSLCCHVSLVGDGIGEVENVNDSLPERLTLTIVPCSFFLNLCLRLLRTSFVSEKSIETVSRGGGRSIERQILESNASLQPVSLPLCPSPPSPSSRLRSQRISCRRRHLHLRLMKSKPQYAIKPFVLKCLDPNLFGITAPTGTLLHKARIRRPHLVILPRR